MNEENIILLNEQFEISCLMWRKKKLSIEIEMHNFNRINIKGYVSLLNCIEILKMIDKFCWREWYISCDL